jgi:hypothetical protein
MRTADCIAQGPLSGANWKTFARIEFFSVWTRTGLGGGRYPRPSLLPRRPNAFASGLSLVKQSGFDLPVMFMTTAGWVFLPRLINGISMKRQDKYAAGVVIRTDGRVKMIEATEIGNSESWKFPTVRSLLANNIPRVCSK